MRPTPQMSSLLAELVCAEAARAAVPGRQPWLQSGVRAVLERLDASPADLAWAAITAAHRQEYRTPAGIGHELERMLARRASQVAAPGVATPTRMPSWRPEPKPDAVPAPVVYLDRVRKLRQDAQNRTETTSGPAPGRSSTPAADRPSESRTEEQPLWT